MAEQIMTNDKELSHELAKMVAELALEKKGENIVVMDVSKIAGFTDYFVVITATSDIHMKALGNYIEDELSTYKVKVWHKEGYENLKWILMDYVDVVVHIFDPETRDFYDLETLWADAEKIIVRDEV